MSRLEPLAAAAASGTMLALCSPPLGLCFFAWLGLIPLFLAWRDSSPKNSFVLGWVAGFFFHGVVFYWIYSTCRFAGMASPIALLAWWALSGFLALHWGLIGYLDRTVAARLPRAAQPWRTAMTWTALSVAWGWWTPRLAGDLLAYTQYRFDSLIQIGAILGPYGLGFLIVLANGVLAEAWEARERNRATLTNVAIVAALIAATIAYGGVSLIQRSLATRAEGTRVEVLQPNIDQYQKWQSDFQRRIMANFEELLARPRAARPQLIVWPETAVPWRVAADAVPEEAVRWSRALGARQVVGVVLEEGGDLYNALLLLDADGKLRGDYRKRELVPFGEYIPFESRLSFLKNIVGILNQLGGLRAGAAEQPLLETAVGRAAGSVCYEAAFPALARRDAARGAQAIVNVTNDGWYKDTWGPYQHFNANRFRAIENRISVIRSGNTGISAVIDPWGVVLAKLDLNARGRLDAQIPEDAFPRRSFYSRRGDWFGALNLAALALLAFP